MENKLSNPNQTVFEQIKRLDENNNEYWTSRDLSKVLEYSEYRHFKPVIDKAKEACKNSSYAVVDHFEDVLDMVPIGSGAVRKVEDVKLSRYASYLIVQNADPGKEIVALGQTYFAVQTRLQEIQQLQTFQQLKTEEEKRLFLRKEMFEHNKQLAAAAKEACKNSGMPVENHIVDFNEMVLIGSSAVRKVGDDYSVALIFSSN